MSPRKDDGRDDGTVLVNLRIPASLNDRLKAAANERCVSPRLMVEAACKQFLDKLPDVGSVLE